ncbi:MAG: FumA C-terminus/TtdB family hydratase beta subunit [Methanomassiliicoccales archaeon]
MRLKTPLSEDVVRSLKAGEVVHMDGLVYTGRDEMHLRALEMHERGEKMPFDLKGAALYHCGPIMKKIDDHWNLLAAGPTTSARMNSLEPRFIETFGIRAIIGKGGMSQPTVDAMKMYGCVYLAITGGAAVLAARGVKQVVGVEWLDFGMPEALWVLEANSLGPLIVGIDAHGNSLFKKVDEEVKRNLPLIRRRLGIE